jgi:hypothetical protein
MAEKVVYKVSPPVNNESLNQLFDATWENHRDMLQFDGRVVYRVYTTEPYVIKSETFV